MGEHKQEKKQDDFTSLVIAFIIGLIIGAGSVWVLVADEQSADTHTDQMREEHMETEEVPDTALTPDVVPTAPDIVPEDTTASNASIVVPNQEAGGTVNVQFVSFEQPGWVVIHELLDSGAFGNALGAQRFNAGEYQGVVSLLRVTEAGEHYAAVLYTDNGDRTFDLDLDLPVRDEAQMIVSAKFQTIN